MQFILHVISQPFWTPIALQVIEHFGIPVCIPILRQSLYATSQYVGVSDKNKKRNGQYTGWYTGRQIGIVSVFGILNHEHYLGTVSCC